MTDATGHLPYWTLEQLAEGDLSRAERSTAEQHLRACAHCQAEMESARSLMAALSALPAVAPSPRFADAVMARVQIAPQAAAVPVEVRAAPAPRARRAWVLLVAMVLAPVAPIWLLGQWLSRHPMVSVGSLWGVGREWVQQVAWGAVVDAAGTLARTGAFSWMAGTVGSLPGPQAAGVPLLLMMILAVIPVSAFTMARLLRAPATRMTHA